MVRPKASVQLPQRDLEKRELVAYQQTVDQTRTGLQLPSYAQGEWLVVRMELLELQSQLGPGRKRSPGNVGPERIQQRISQAPISGTPTQSRTQRLWKGEVQRPSNYGHR